MKKLIAAALCAALGVAPAGAVSFIKSFSGAPDPGATGGLTIDFESDTLPDGITLSGQYQFLTGFVPHQGYAPAGDTSRYLSVPGAGVSGTATIDFSKYTGTELGDFSFYWGSVDRANELVIKTSLNTLTILGSSLITSGFGNMTTPRGNRRVFFSLEDGEKIQSMTLSSPAGFEIDDLVFDRAAPPPPAGVPEPANWALLITGFGMAGAALRRRREVSRIATAG